MENLTAEFNDGSLELSKEGLFTVIGETAHKYYFKLSKLEREGKDVRAIFKGFLNQTIIL